MSEGILLRACVPKRLVLATVGALAVIALMLLTPSATTSYAASDIDYIAIDMNTAGNNTVSCAGTPNPPHYPHCAPGTIGSVQTCAEVDPGGTVNVDIVVSSIPSGIAPSGAGPDIQGFDIDFLYNPAIAKVTAAPANAGSGGPPGNLGIEYAGTPHGTHVDTNDSYPDMDGSFHTGQLDFGATGEYGPGILMRLTLQGVGPGITSLNLANNLGGNPDALIYDNSGSQKDYTIGDNRPATLAVHPSTCPPPPPAGVGGNVALVVSSAQSSFPWSTAAAAGVGLMSAALGAFWYLRRRLSTSK